ncbi:uncharacterized protein B0T15DRAFT_563457 [Chaetomium strumarium]|uniref:J domain-containing protein n=1 Tax=Chaetomium strumarium TaxID=1170767 RepID=A0AAJ0GKV2_9PEZI|nr:hypothetical protein B0T15DRAFT_563457 [Chaetomium strumarium]
MATEEQIKRAHRKKVLKHHPDKNATSSRATSTCKSPHRSISNPGKTVKLPTDCDAELRNGAAFYEFIKSLTANAKNDLLTLRSAPPGLKARHRKHLFGQKRSSAFVLH